VAALVADLVDPNAGEAVEGIVRGPSVIDHPGDDRPDRSPGHTHEGDHRRLGGVGNQPGDLVIEVAGVAGAVAGPGHLGNRRTVLGAVHPGSVGLQITHERAEVQCPPVPPALPLVVAGSTASAAPAPALGRAPRTDVDNDGFRLFVEVDRLDHRGPVDTEQFPPYAGSEHAILLAEFSGPSISQKT